MNALGFVLAAGGVVVAYEAFKHLHTLGAHPASAASAPSGANSGAAGAAPSPGASGNTSGSGDGSAVPAGSSYPSWWRGWNGGSETWGEQLSGSQIAQLVRNAGGTAQEASVMAQLALRESSGWTQIPARTPNDPYRGYWGGLWQDIPPTGMGIGLTPGADPQTQAARNLTLFRRNGGSDWVQPGYPLPAPGPYE